MAVCFEDLGQVGQPHARLHGHRGVAGAVLDNAVEATGVDDEVAAVGRVSPVLQQAGAARHDGQA